MNNIILHSNNEYILVSIKENKSYDIINLNNLFLEFNDIYPKFIHNDYPNIIIFDTNNVVHIIIANDGIKLYGNVYKTTMINPINISHKIRYDGHRYMVKMCIMGYDKKTNTFCCETIKGILEKDSFVIESQKEHFIDKIEKYELTNNDVFLFKGDHLIHHSIDQNIHYNNLEEYDYISGYYNFGAFGNNIAYVNKGVLLERDLRYRHNLVEYNLAIDNIKLFKYCRSYFIICFVNNNNKIIIKNIKFWILSRVWIYI